MVLLQLLSIHDGAIGVTNLGVILLWYELPFSNDCVTVLNVGMPFCGTQNLFNSVKPTQDVKIRLIRDVLTVGVLRKTFTVYHKQQVWQPQLF